MPKPTRRTVKSIAYIYMHLLYQETEHQNRIIYKVSKGAKITNRWKQVPHLTQNTNEKVTNSQLDTTNESQVVSLFPAGGHKAYINRRAQSHSKHKTEKHKKIHKRSTALERPDCFCK